MATYQGNYRDYVKEEEKRLKDNRASAEDRSIDSVRKQELARLRGTLVKKKDRTLGSYLTNINSKKKIK